MGDIMAGEGKAYRTDALAKAVESVTAMKRGRSAGKASDLRTVFERMAAVNPKQAKGLGYCLESWERRPFAEYLFDFAEDKGLPTLAIALTDIFEDMAEQKPTDKKGKASEGNTDAGDQASEFAEYIYRQCLIHYDRKAIKPVFEELSYQTYFCELLKQLHGFDAKALLGAFAGGEAVVYISDRAAAKASKDNSFYIDALESFVPDKNTKIYKECGTLAVLVCDAKEYRRIGADKLMTISEDFDEVRMKKLLRNMITTMDDYQLQAFVPMLGDFIKLTGEKGSPDYTGALEGLTPLIVERYDRWTSLYKIRLVLGDGPVAEFWYGYVDDAVIMRFEKLDTITADFGNFVVVEIKGNDAAYFYDREYYLDTVTEGFNVSGNARELEKWLHDKTEWGSSGEHLTRWRKSHTGRWQMSFKDHIRKSKNNP